MKKKISVLVLVSMFAAGSAMASGWRIPEQSVDSTAKAGANIASSTRADASYFNPANMAWMEDTWHAQLDLTYIYLSEIDYDDNRTNTFDGNSEKENFFVPTGFVVSPSYSGARFGLAITAPAGLSKRWKDDYPKSFAKEFTLEVIEVNPTVSYSFGDMVSIAAGPRMLYAKAKVESDGYDNTPVLPGARKMDDSTTEWGWNVALAVKPIEKLNLSATYRSKVDLDFHDNNAKLSYGPKIPQNPFINGSYDAKVSVPVPAVFALSVAYDVLDNLNVELTWDRTFWSKYNELDFDFKPDNPNNPFEAPVDKDWDDTNAFRIGLTYAMNDTWTFMGGFAYDESPAPDKNINFELPESNAWIYSLGAQYKVNEQMDLGIAALYDYKESNKVTNDNVDGKFTNASALLVSVGMNYKF